MKPSRRRKNGGKNGTGDCLVAQRGGTRTILVADGRNGSPPWIMEGLSENSIKEGNRAIIGMSF